MNIHVTQSKIIHVKTEFVSKILVKFQNSYHIYVMHHNKCFLWTFKFDN